LERIRDEKKFATAQELIEAIQNDVYIGQNLITKYNKDDLLKESLFCENT